MEKAIFIEELKHPDKETPLSAEYTRIYFGEEFCGRRLPSKRGVDAVVALCEATGRGLTFLTPIVTEPELAVLHKLTGHLLALAKNKSQLDLEIVFNDLGFFESLKGTGGFRPVLGHMLTGQKRDPGFLLPFHPNKTRPEDRTHMRGVRVDANKWINTYIKKNFKRVELVNTVQGCDLDVRLPQSLYIPLVPVAVTRYCKWAAREAGAQNASNYFDCGTPCRKNVAKAVIKGVPIYLYGNTQFYINMEMGPPSPNVDRLVLYSFSVFPV
ncbi:MAG: hypothetical protein HQM16_15555 [Deltaproteobacteria bacterium]|nr:hypothetical protein [Deltaproteobacteria bacterium]